MTTQLKAPPVTAAAAREPRWYPIGFSGPMVRALLDGRKSQTRRLILPPPPADAPPTICDQPLDGGGFGFYDDSGRLYRSRVGGPGDRLYVRETWAEVYEAEEGREDGHPPTSEECRKALRRALYRATAVVPENAALTWKPWIHMPRWASRISLEVLEVRIQRLQAITEAEAHAEGIQAFTKDRRLWKYWPCDPSEGEWRCAWADLPRTARDAFASAWDILHTDPGIRWTDNPWVRAVTVRRLEEPHA